ncbi:hypothetical protein [Novosphingobium lindaniclasticum]
MACTLLFCSGSSAIAQTGDAAGNAVANLLGAIVHGAHKASAQNSWNGVDQATRSCVDTAMSSKGSGIEALIRSGVSAKDQRLSTLLNFCHAVMSKQLLENFPCTLADGSGAGVATLCEERFTSNSNGKTTALDRDSFIRLAASGSPVSITAWETPAATAARIAAAQDQRRQASLKAEQDRVKANQEAQRELKDFRPY